MNFNIHMQNIAIYLLPFIDLPLQSEVCLTVFKMNITILN